MEVGVTVSRTRVTYKGLGRRDGLAACDESNIVGLRNRPTTASLSGLCCSLENMYYVCSRAAHEDLVAKLPVSVAQRPCQREVYSYAR